MGRISAFFNRVFRGNKTKMLENGQEPTDQKEIDYDEECNKIMEKIEALEKKYISLEKDELRAIFGSNLDEADKLAFEEDEVRNKIIALKERIKLLEKMERDAVAAEAIRETQAQMVQELKGNESLRESIRFEGVEPPNPAQNGSDIEVRDDSRGEK